MRYGTDFSYAIPVSAAGTYLVRLHTSELNFATAGSRRFTITAEGRAVAADLDLAKAPGQRNPWTLGAPVAITDGKLDLRFTAALDYAQISAIEVISTGSVDPYRLVWGDEFSGTTVDSTRWNVRNDSWQDNEESINTARPQNVFISNGTLTIRSLRETRTVGNTTRQFTSGYLDTLDKQSWTYGRFEMRARLATQQNTSKGIWPAFWMRPTGGGVGEIDIMEAIGSGAGGTEWNRTHQTIHHDYERLQPAQSFTTAFPTGTSPSDGFHTYAVQWEPGALTWFIDGKQVWRRDRTTTTWFDEAFARPYHLRLNQQVGGTWAGTPDSATAFPADYIIDWVRVYQK
jgi:beta-glucanase (GH16 family)